jgi:hypothetical protein
LWRTAFSCLKLSSSLKAAVARSSYVDKSIRYYSMILEVFCWTLNKYCEYLANEAIMALK